MAEPSGPLAPGEEAPVPYDGDAKLLAFLGAVAFVAAALFWSLLGVRLAVERNAAWPTGPAAALASAAFFFLAWRLRVQMEEGRAVGPLELNRMLAAGLTLGVVAGALPYLVLRFKLEDVDFVHLASEPGGDPPAAP